MSACSKSRRPKRRVDVGQPPSTAQAIAVLLVACGVFASSATAAPEPAQFAGLGVLRPYWLFGLLALPPLLWWLRRRGQRQAQWQRSVDPHLLPHLLHGGADVQTRALPWLVGVALSLALLALSGPSWRSLPQPLLRERTPLMIVLDLSPAIRAADTAPDRLRRARAKIERLLASRSGQIGLVVYAEDAFVVAPLTDDAANVGLFLDALSPEIMPQGDNAAAGAGSRADRGIALAAEALERGRYRVGDILLIGHAAGSRAASAAEDAADAGFRVSVLAVGTAGGGLYRDRSGGTRTSTLDAAGLRAVAAAGNGGYAVISADDSDLEQLDVLRAGQLEGEDAGRRAALRLDEGYWLLPPLLLLALLGFRRGALSLLALCLLLPVAPPAQAFELWRRQDQIEHARHAQGLAAYREGDFAAAESAWRGLPGADSAYNHGNALARLGRYREALEAYDRALRLQPGLADAAENRRIVEDALRRNAGRDAPPPPQQSQAQRRQQGDGSKSQSGGGRDGERSQQAGAPETRPGQPPKPRDAGQPPPGQGDGKPQPQPGRPGTPPQQQAQTPPPPGGKSGQPQPPSGQTPPAGTPPAQAQPRPPGGEPAPGQPPGRDGRPPPDAGQSGTAAQVRPGQADAGKRAGEGAGDDPEAQRRADAAQRAGIDRALDRGAGDRGRTAQAGGRGTPSETEAERRQRLLIEARLRRIEDDPGALLRAKFELEQRRRTRDGDTP